MTTIHARLVAVILFVSGALLALLLLLTHSVPLSETGIGLAMCDVPCWAGIEPGRTLFADSTGILTARFADAELSPSQDRLDFDMPSANVTGVLWANQRHVDQIYARVSQPVWTIILRLGTPQCIQYIDPQILPEIVIIYWQFDDVQVMSPVNLARADPETMTDAIQLWQSPPESPCVISDNIAPWPGYFALG